MYKFGKIHVIADRVAQHARSKDVTEFLQENSNRVKLSFSPTSSSYLNATEEVWHQGKAKVHRPFAYLSLDKMRIAIMKFYITTRFNPDIMKYIARMPPPDCFYL